MIQPASRALPLLERLNPYRFCLLAIICFPFLQMGSSLFISCQGLLIATLIALFISQRTPFDRSILWLFIATTSFIISFSIYPNIPFSIPREIRYLLGGSLVCWILAQPFKIGEKRQLLEQAAYYMALFLFICTSLQHLLMMSGIYILIPNTWYVNYDDPALAMNWVEHAMNQGFATNLRSSTFYSEPSYLGLLATILYYIQQSNHRRWLPLPFLIAFSTSAASGTGLGIASSLALSLFFLSRRHAAVLLTLLACAILVIITISSFDDLAGGRAEAIISGNDQSANVRIFYPLRIIAIFWSTSIVGIPLTGIEHVVGSNALFDINGENPFQNGILNFMYAFGLIAIPLLTMYFWRKPLVFMFIFLVIASQNGAIFELDKIALYALAWMVTPSPPEETVNDKPFHPLTKLEHP